MFLLTMTIHFELKLSILKTTRLTNISVCSFRSKYYLIVYMELQLVYYTRECFCILSAIVSEVIN